MMSASMLLRAGLLACALPVAAAAQDLPNPFLSDAVETLIHGVYCAEAPVSLETAPDTAAGVVNIVPNLPEMRAVTTLVPAQIGVGFGVLVTAPEGGAIDPARITITHPPYPDSGIEVERWQTAIPEGEPGLIGFSFEVESELVTGPWVMLAEDESGAMLFRVAFEVVPPALLPDLAQGCSGAILS